MGGPTNLAIFASGSGTNAENIIKYFDSHASIHVKQVLSNKENAGVHLRAERLGVPSSTFSREEYEDSSFLSSLVDIDYIVLAGFLWLIPQYLVKAFPGKIINIHPALLPNFGGKGMYGNHVHQAVIDAGETTSGITIHLVNEEYDKGEILFQASCSVEKADTAESLAAKIHALEYEHFPRVIEEYIVSQ